MVKKLTKNGATKKFTLHNNKDKIVENDNKVSEEFSKEFVEKIDEWRIQMKPENITIKEQKPQIETFLLRAATEKVVLDRLKSFKSTSASGMTLYQRLY